MRRTSTPELPYPSGSVKKRSLSGFAEQRFTEHESEDAGSSGNGEEFIGFAHSSRRERVWPFEVCDDAVSGKLLRLGGICEFDNREQNTEFGSASVNGHKGRNRDKGSNPYLRDPDGATKKLFRLGAVVIGKKRLTQEVGCQVIDGDVPAFQRVFIWLYVGHFSSSPQWGSIFQRSERIGGNQEPAELRS